MAILYASLLKRPFLSRKNVIKVIFSSNRKTITLTANFTVIYLYCSVHCCSSAPSFENDYWSWLLQPMMCLEYRRLFYAKSGKCRISEQMIYICMHVHMYICVWPTKSNFSSAYSPPPVTSHVTNHVPKLLCKFYTIFTQFFWSNWYLHIL